MSRISQEIIDRILSSTDIVDIISDSLQLKKTGASFKALCPFHNEKTPSFVVSPDKQIYHCFGCGAGGNAINFLMKYENIEFIEAVKMLASKTGIEIPKDDAKKYGESSSLLELYEVNKLAMTFYQNILRSEKGKTALEYLRARGVSNESLNMFRLGFSLDEWEALKRYCEKKNIPLAVLKKAGLVVTSEDNKSSYDRFRGRAIFPIFNERGSAIAFGGRILTEELPKYINSSESAVYIKGNVLYGLSFAKASIREKGFAIIVEGYMDVIIPFQYGITNIVATSGTSLTPRQVATLKRYAKESVIVFDSDKAGQAASLRGLDILVENGMGVRIATLPEGLDPDNFVRKNGKEAFSDIIKKSKNLFDYKLEIVLNKFGKANIGGIIDEMLPTISKVQNMVIQSDYLKKLAERLQIHEASLRYEMRKVKSDYSYRYELEGATNKLSKNYRNSEVHLLGLAILNKRYFDKIQNELGLDNFRNENIRKIMLILSGMFGRDDSDINPAKLLARIGQDEQNREIVVEALAKADITCDVDKALSDCISCVRRENREEKIRELTKKLKEAHLSSNDVEIMTLVAKINELHKTKIPNG